jgi:hypothetical protein
MKNKRCFIISPIGAEGSQIREHADDVYDFVIKDAMEACGIKPIRSDHLREPGKISEHMFNEILKDDLCIAVLTGYNPNVFYELAIAQAAARPVIILLEKGQKLPFDVHDLRCVYYDLRPRPLFEKVYVKEVIEHIEALEKAGWKGTTPWSGFPSVYESIQADNVKFLPQSQHFGSSDSWLQLLQNTTNVFELMGISLASWRRTRSFSATLKEKALNGCKIRILLMHPDNHSLRHLINDGIPETRYRSVLQGLKEACQYFTEIARTSTNIEVRQLRYGCPHCQMTRTDQQAVFVMYLFSELSHFSPLWQCPEGSPMYALMAQEMEALWKANAPGGLKSKGQFAGNRGKTGGKTGTS